MLYVLFFLTWLTLFLFGLGPILFPLMFFRRRERWGGEE